MALKTASSAIPWGADSIHRCSLAPKGTVHSGLSAQQIRAAKNIYAGPTTSKGVRISTSGLLPGTELDWNEPKNPSAEVAEFFKYVLFQPSPGPDWTIHDFNFDHDYQRLGIGALFTDSDPDLRKFKAAGAKLIVAQVEATPWNSLEESWTITKP